LKIRKKAEKEISKFMYVLFVFITNERGSTIPKNFQKLLSICKNPFYWLRIRLKKNFAYKKNLLQEKFY
jgi:hypothetical protein